MSITILLVLFGLAMSAGAMYAALTSLSVSHVRHWARRKHPDALKLYPLKARGSAVLLTLGLVLSMAICGIIIVLTSLMSAWVCWVATSIVLFLTFAVLTPMYLKPLGMRLLAMLNRPLLALTHFLKPVTVRFGRALDHLVDTGPVTLTKTQLSHLVNGVREDDTDLTNEELQIIRHALSFGSKKVRDIMKPWSKVTSVKAEELLTPIVLDELHKTTHSRFPVRSGSKDIIGVLYMFDLREVSSEPKPAKEVMHRPVVFVNEDRELDHVLQAFLKFKQHMLIVVDREAEVVGIITLDDVVAQILGEPVLDAFDNYDDIRAVAAASSKPVAQQKAESVVE